MMTNGFDGSIRFPGMRVHCGSRAVKLPALVAIITTLPP